MAAIHYNGVDLVKHRLCDFSEILNNAWMVIMSVMIILSQVGYIMIEIGTIKTINNTNLL